MRDRMRAVMLWALAPVAVIVIPYIALYLVFRNDRVLIGVIMLTGLVWLVGFLVLPFYLSRLSRRRIPAFLGPARDQQLRQLCGLRSWGVGKHLVVLRKIPSREAFVETLEP